MKLIQIVELIRNLCNQHPEINSFNTGLAHEVNKDYQQYPAAFLIFPYRKIIIPNSTNEQVEYEIKLRVAVNTVEVDDPIAPVAFQTNYFNQEPTVNEIAAPIVDETKQREMALRLLSHLIEGLRLKQDCTPWYKLLRGDITSLERSDNDMITGAQITLRFRTADDYACEGRQIFNNVCGDFTFPVDDVVLLPPPVRYSMIFDGVNEYLTQPNSSLFNFGTSQPFSIAAWIDPNGASFPVITKFDTIPTGFNGWFTMVLSSGVMRLQMRSGAGNSTSSVIDSYSVDTVNQGQWNHVVWTYDGSRQSTGIKMYINGVESAITVIQGTAITSGNFTNTLPVTIGSLPNLNVFGNADCNSVNMWSKALTQQEILVEHLQLGGGTTNTTDLMMENRMGDLATFDGTNWTFPDTLGQSVGFTSVNMDLSNRISSIPI